MVVRDLSGALERHCVPAGVVGGPGDCLEREDVLVEEVAAADLERVDSEFERGLVGEPLDQCRGLGSACAAVRTHWCGVGDRHSDIELELGDCIGALGHVA